MGDLINVGPHELSNHQKESPKSDAYNQDVICVEMYIYASLLILLVGGAYAQQLQGEQPTEHEVKSGNLRLIQ